VARDEKLEQLRRVPLFAGMDRSDIERLGAIAESVDVPDGQVLTREGATGREFFIVLEGRVRITQGDHEIAHLGPGDFLGEIALIDGKPRTATAIADGPTHLLVIGRSGFLSLMDSYPSVRLAVLEALASRLRAHEPATS
jgi:CRP-like cAMP-binding protein